MKHCARCGKRLPNEKERRIYSSWTRSYYCTDIDACDKRARKLKRRESTTCLVR